ncbi:MAG: alpha-amylase family glycosyl hydrolase [Planctomycetota bacterium]
MPYRWFVGLAGTLLILALGSAEAASHTFRFEAPPDAQTVHVAGSFNGWSSSATPMQPRDGAYVATIDLPDGVHLYKFVVNGDRWLNDPASDHELEESDGHGGVNSAVLIGLDARQLPAPRPGHVRADAVIHDPDTDTTLIDDGWIVVRFRAQRGDLERAVLVLDDGQGPRRVPFEPAGDALGFTAYRAEAAGLPDPAAYAIELVDGDATVVLDRGGLPFGLSTDLDVETPDWARDAVWYQVFAERFRNGDPSNDPGDAEFETLLPWTSDWWATHTEHGEVAGEENFYTGHGNVWRRRYGGDLRGVADKLDYLRDLGVNAIYFNPIFEAESMHKYDASDFRHIDDNFGVKGDWPVAGETDDPATWTWTASDRVFLDFLAEAKAKGFKVIIDGVFNHVGQRHYAFQDVLENGPDSVYADWFVITDWGDPANHGRPETYGQPGGIQWDAWDEHNGALPAFKKDDSLGLAPGPRQHIFDITRRWMDPDGDGDPSDGIDGWRLDVPGDIPHPFWRDWRVLVKSINSDAYISGEIWGMAEPWLRGDQFDAVMNYQFAMPALDFLADERDATTPTDFLSTMRDLVYAYPLPVSFVQQNLYASHDTDRLASMFVNPDRPYDGENRLQDTGPHYDARRPNDAERARHRLAVALQMTFLGAPMIYYGDEAGMWSPDDPSDRMPMIWADLAPYEGQQRDVDTDLLAWYRRMIALRHTEPALRRGAFVPVLADDATGVVAFARELDGRRAYVVLNRSDRASRATLDGVPAGRWVDLVDPRNAEVVIGDGPSDRPRLALTPDARRQTVAEGDSLSVDLDPWSAAVFVPESLD